MPLYIVVNANGAQQRVSPTPLEPSDEQTLVVLAEFDAEPSNSTHVWNPQTGTYDLRVPVTVPPISRTKLSRREFRARLGQSCRLQINARLATPAANATEVQLISALQDMKDELLSVAEVDVTHPTTVQAVNFLVSIGYLTSEQGATALAPSTVMEE